MRWRLGWEYHHHQQQCFYTLQSRTKSESETEITLEIVSNYSENSTPKYVSCSSSSDRLCLSARQSVSVCNNLCSFCIFCRFLLSFLHLLKIIFQGFSFCSLPLLRSEQSEGCICIYTAHFGSVPIAEL